MAFSAAHLVLAGPDGNGNAGRNWRYKTEDAHATVDTSGYFNNASDLLQVGDVITVVVVTNIDTASEAVSTYGNHIVLSNASGVVDVSNVTVGVVTDSD